MNILLVEDNKIKKRAIEVNLLKLDPQIRLRWFNNLEQAEDFVDKYVDEIDLMVLDWCFPEKEAETAKEGTGRKMLDYIEDKHYPVKTVVCSGNDLDSEELQEKYTNCLGAVLFGACNAAKEIKRLYLDYWANLSDRCNKPANIKLIHPQEEAPLVKKLVNKDVK